MSTTIIISDVLAAALEERRARDGFPSLDAAAEAAIAEGMGVDVTDMHLDGRTVDDLRALIDEADASGAEIAWDSAATRGEILRRYAERSRRT